MTDTPVLIVGAGPVGQLAALLLARHGIASRLIDRRESPATAPKAHAVNPRTLEICDSLGISGDRLRAIGAAANEGGAVHFVGTLTGPLFGTLPYERQDEAALADTPFPLTNMPQPDFEAVLAEAIAAEPRITFTRGVTCIQAEDRGSHVDAALASAARGAVETVTCDYLIAADGAGSRLREAQGIAMHGPKALQHYLMIHFEADLRELTADRPGVLYFLFDPGCDGVLIAYDRAKTWVLMHPLDPAADDPDDFDDARCHALVDAAIGRAVPEARIRNKSPWSMSAQVAERYRAGRIFLAGDAAHRFPPTGGLGLNTGAGDAQNLTWKLAAVLKGEAGEALLETYEAERRPVARINSEQSLTNAARIFELVAALQGGDPAGAKAHYAAAAADPAADAICAAVEAQRPHFDSFNLQLGYRYVSDAVWGAAPLPKASDIDISAYDPCWQPGVRVPHRWVTRGNERVSLLSLLAPDRFTLITGPRANGAFAGETSVPLVRLAAGTDFRDENDDWAELTGLPDDGALLVRPDGHIGCRFDGTADAPPLADALTQLLARG